MGADPRETAFKILLKAEKNTRLQIDDVLNQHLAAALHTDSAKRWITEVVYGTTRMRDRLDMWIRQAFKGQYSKAEHAVKVLLRMGVYQLKHMQTANHAAVNETVALCQKVRLGRAKGLINAVLRKTAQLDTHAILSAYGDDVDKRIFTHSHPAWLIKRWDAAYGSSATDELCQYNNRSPRVWIRRNRLQVEQEEFENFLDTLGVPFERSDLMDVFYTVQNSGALLSTEAFNQGWFSFQDIAAGLVAHILQPESGETIADLCAAPGGKTTFLAELSGAEAQILAADASEARLEKVKENIKRLRLNNVRIQSGDATQFEYPKMDKILLDVPCSGTGVYGRRADARWKHTETDIEELNTIQAKILQHNWQFLKPGGTLLYATCSLEAEENWLLIDRVLPHLPNAAVEPLDAHKYKAYIDERGALATLPWLHEMDGMFAVKLRKSL